MTEIVCPGKRLGRISEFRAGPGTYVRGSYIYASVVGPKTEQAAGDDDGKPFIVVSGLAWHLGYETSSPQEDDGNAVCMTRVFNAEAVWFTL